MIVFGGQDANNVYLNDVWVMCVADCPVQALVYEEKDAEGLPLLITECPQDRCRWQEKLMTQTWEEWYAFVDDARATDLRGVVPLRPAGRAGHSAVIGTALTAGSGGRPVMTVFGGRSPNCSDYCADLWQYSILDNSWFMVYGEWEDRDLRRHELYNYSAYNQRTPRKRHAHAAVAVGDDLYVWGGHTNGSSHACCGQRPCMTAAENAWYVLADEDCPFLNDLWVTSLKGYEPFMDQVARGKHTQQSSTIGAGVAGNAVDGMRLAYAHDGSATHTHTDSQAWWQVDLGAVHTITNVTIYNALDDQHQRLQNFYVLLSAEPFVSDRLQECLRDPQVWKAHVMYLDDGHISAVIINQPAQYVRIQLSSTDYLSLSEVEVWGFPKVEAWQHLYGMKRWTQLYPHPEAKVPATPRAHATITAIQGNKLLIHGGHTREAPYWLADMYLVHLAEYHAMARDGVRWYRLEARARQPMDALPLGRQKHASVFSPVCSAGYAIEQQARSDSLLSDPPAWCQGQVVIYAGKTEAAVDTEHLAHPNGFLGDLWIYNVSSNVASRLEYDTALPHPARRSGHSVILHQDLIYVYGGNADPTDCEGGSCGDAWAINISGPGSCGETCSGHGLCEFGFCVCKEGFLGELCDRKACPNSRCFQDYANHRLECILCSNNGVCDDQGSCTCNKGWQGEDCSILHCPGGCSGHGVCKLGGTCECDAGFGGLDCFLAMCPNNCTEWSDGIDQGTRGDCEITRDPPCCGTEPACEYVEGESPQLCTKRSSGFETTPPHDVEAVCYCADAYTGIDCSQEVADVVMDA